MKATRIDIPTAKLASLVILALLMGCTSDIADKLRARPVESCNYRIHTYIQSQPPWIIFSWDRFILSLFSDYVLDEKTLSSQNNLNKRADRACASPLLLWWAWASRRGSVLKGVTWSDWCLILRGGTKISCKDWFTIYEPVMTKLSTLRWTQ